jgi:mRNA interferase MazF
MRGEVYRLPARGKGHEQQGRRYAVVLQPDWLTLSTWIVAFTSTSARETSFRPPVEIAERRTLVMCDQIATVDLNRLTEPAGPLTLEEMQRVDEALTLVLDLWRTGD